MSRPWSSAIALFTCAGLACVACGTSATDAEDATGPSPLIHLDELLPRARVIGALAPSFAQAERTWRFDELLTNWHPLPTDQFPKLARVITSSSADSLRLSLAQLDGAAHEVLIGGFAVELPDSSRDAWSGLRVRARSRSRWSGIAAVRDIDETAVAKEPASYYRRLDTSPVFSDGSVQDYFLSIASAPAESAANNSKPHGHEVVLFAAAPRAAELEILSITLVPRGAAYREGYGMQTLTRSSTTRQTIFAHAPATLAFVVRVPELARLDLGLTCLEGESVTYSVKVDDKKHASKSVLEEKLEQSAEWKQCSIDLSAWAGTEVELSLEARSDVAGTVALWGSPIVSSGLRSARPNVIFYVIDGGGADFMSVYGYNRRTTPYLERLVSEGVVFEHAHSNSSWTQPSTASFMTSLHHSVLGGLQRGVNSTPVPTTAVTMAEHMRRGGYQTEVLTSNPNAARVIGLERAVDLMRDVTTGQHGTSSTALHEWFWRWRHDYPASPYWVHFQTTDVHEPNQPTAPYAGLFVAPGEQAWLEECDQQIYLKAGELFGTMSVAKSFDIGIKRVGIDSRDYYNVCRGLYDETMAHQDRELARFVDRLKAEGEWENTLLIIAADHGHPACTFARFGRGLIEPQPEGWQGALFDPYLTHVPFIFIWPSKIAGGRRIEQSVSMIDVLPTILDLVGLPQPEISQGRSLAPLLRGGELAPKPVILDEFRVDEASGKMVGNLEIIDGRWGASLEIGPPPHDSDPSRGRHAVPAGGRWGAVHEVFPEAPRLLLYDLWNDPFATHAVNEEHPELVERYRKTLLEHWQVQQTLAQHFHQDDNGKELAPEVLRQLQALGYVR